MAETILLWLTVVLSLGLVALAFFAAKKTKRVRELDAEIVRIMQEKDAAVERYKGEVSKLQDQRVLLSSIGEKVDVVDRRVTELGAVPEKIDRLAEFWQANPRGPKKLTPKMTFDTVVDEISRCKKSLKIATPVFPVDNALSKAILHAGRTVPVQILSQENGAALSSLREEGIEVALAEGADMGALILDYHKVVCAGGPLGRDMVTGPDFEVVTDRERVAKTAQAFDSLWDTAQKL